MDVSTRHWSLPEPLFDPEDYILLPRHGIARGFKASKENVVGLIVALHRFADRKWPEHDDLAARIAMSLRDVLAPDEAVSVNASSVWGGHSVELSFSLSAQAELLYGSLREGEPAIEIDPTGLDSGLVTIATNKLSETEFNALVQRVTMILDSM